MAEAVTDPERHFRMTTASARRTLSFLFWIMIGCAAGLTFLVVYGCALIPGALSKGLPAFALPVPLLLRLAMSARRAGREVSGPTGWRSP